MRGPKASLGLEARGPAAQWSLSSPGLMTFPPSCQHLGLQFGSVWAQAGMPSAAPPGRPAGGGLSYSWNSCFHVPERERGAGAVHPEQNLVGPRSPGPAAVLGAPGVGCCSACPGVTTPPPGAHWLHRAGRVHPSAVQCSRRELQPCNNSHVETNCE